MPAMEIPLHYVCTRDAARTMVDGLERFWLSNCGCREERGKCERSRMDVCYFGARTMRNERLNVARERCYGCGLCVDACPHGCVTMDTRE